MEIKISNSTITINGNIKSIGDFQTIKNSIDGMISTNKNIVINIVDSISITSSTIGYFNKLILKDGISIQMNIGNPQLMELVEDLNLQSTFRAKKV
jgi:hypothetical protein